MPIALCRIAEFWYLAAYEKGNLGRWTARAGLRMPNHGGFHSSGGSLSKVMSSTQGVTFYAQIRFQGARVRPVQWNADENSPILEIIIGHEEVAAGRVTEEALRAAGLTRTRDYWCGKLPVSALELTAGDPMDVDL